MADRRYFDQLTSPVACECTTIAVDGRLQSRGRLLAVEYEVARLINGVVVCHHLIGELATVGEAIRKLRQALRGRVITRSRRQPHPDDQQRGQLAAVKSPEFRREAVRAMGQVDPDAVTPAEQRRWESPVDSLHDHWA